MNYEQFASQLNELNSKSLNGLFALTEKSVERTQKLAELNFSTAKELLTETQETVETALSAKDPQALISMLQDGQFEQFGGKIYAQQQAIAKVVREAGEELSEVAEAGVNQFQEGLKQWLNTVSSNAPAGSDAFISALKTSVETTLQGLGQLQAAAKEATLNAEKTAEDAVEAFKGQVSSVKKAAATVTASATKTTRARK